MTRLCLAVGLLVATIACCSSQRINFAALINGATCTASTFSFGAECFRALDSRETNGFDEWITTRENGGWIQVNFAQPGMINEVRFLQRCPQEDHSKDITIRFDDGSEVQTVLTCGPVGMKCEDISWERLVFPPRFTQSVNITIDSPCSDGGFTGFREVTVSGTVITEVENEGNLVLARVGGTCEASSNENPDHTCDHAIDGVLGSNLSESWASAFGEVVGATLKLSLPSLSRVSKLRLLSKCLGIQQIGRILVETDEGLTQEWDIPCVPGFADDFCPEVPWHEIGLSNIATNGMTITVLGACWSNATNVGFQEVEILGSAEGDQSCPFDFDQQPFLSSCYKFISAPEDRVSLEQARDVCSGLHPNAHLVEINNMAEQDYLARTAETLRVAGATCLRYYTDGYEASPSDWRWFTSGRPVILPFWYSDTPPSSKSSAGKLRWNEKGELDLEPSSKEQVSTEAPQPGSYIATSYVPGAGPFDQWYWSGTDGVAPGCFVCEIFTGL